MKYADIQEAIRALTRISAELEEQYIQNEGEVTPEAEAMEEEKEALTALLQEDGIDSLGRWLTMKEEDAKMWKNEKAAADRMAKSAEKTISFIKDKISEVMAVTGMDKAKGKFYGFSRYESVTTKVDTDLLSERYQALVDEAVRDAGLPCWIDVELKAKVSNVPDEMDLPDVFCVSRKDAVRFTKPKKAKEE